mmetsp:Transcript_43716/g.69482  ORF Transcript_43716/g.69482 Transcript_43716/m.69482 type:complete len:257 (-) Transcript_43716:15-785(-)
MHHMFGPSGILSHIWDVHHLVLCGHPSGQRRSGFLNPKPAIHAAGEGAPELVAVLLNGPQGGSITFKGSPSIFHHGLHDLGQLLLLLGSFGCFQVNNQQVAHADEAAQNHSTHASQGADALHGAQALLGVRQVGQRQPQLQRRRLDGATEGHSTGVAQHLAHGRCSQCWQAQGDTQGVVDGIPRVEQDTLIYDAKGHEGHSRGDEQPPHLQRGGLWHITTEGSGHQPHRRPQALQPGAGTARVEEGHGPLGRCEGC